MQEFDPELILEDSLSSTRVPVRPWRRTNDDDGDGYYRQLLQAVSKNFSIPFNVPVGELSLKQRDVIIYGPPAKQQRIKIEYKTGRNETRYYETAFTGVIPNLQKRYDETTSDYVRSKLEEYMSVRPCPVCQGKRLRPEALAVTIQGRNIAELTDLPVVDSLQWIEWLRGATPHLGQRRRAAYQRQRSRRRVALDATPGGHRQPGAQGDHGGLGFMVNVGLTT
ncbi:MAG: hypothetical protein R2838_20360 [Caldilineaceae bacterium]